MANNGSINAFGKNNGGCGDFGENRENKFYLGVNPLTFFIISARKAFLARSLILKNGRRRERDKIFHQHEKERVFFVGKTAIGVRVDLFLKPQYG